MKLAFYNAWRWDTSLLDWCIALWDLGSFSHVEIVFESRGKMFSSSPRSKTGDGKPLIKGSRFIDIPSDLYTSGKWTVVDIPNVTPDMEAWVYIWCEREAKENKGYDFAGVLHFLRVVRWLLSFVGLNISHDPEKWFCSETVMEKLDRLYGVYGPKRLPDFGRFAIFSPHEVSPNGLYEICRGRKPVVLPWIAIIRAITRVIMNA